MSDSVTHSHTIDAISPMSLECYSNSVDSAMTLLSTITLLFGVNLSVMKIVLFEAKLFLNFEFDFGELDFLRIIVFILNSSGSFDVFIIIIAYMSYLLFLVCNRTFFRMVLEVESVVLATFNVAKSSLLLNYYSIDKLYENYFGIICYFMTTCLFYINFT